MPAPRQLNLNKADYNALDRVRRTDPTPYKRERAAALIKIHHGWSAARVGREGLLIPRDPDTVLSWVNAFEERGLDGLTIAPGRGRKPSFSP